MKTWELIFGSLGVAAAAVLVMATMTIGCAAINNCMGEKYADEFFVSR
mgnify:CR=1 FL=1